MQIKIIKFKQRNKQIFKALFLECDMIDLLNFVGKHRQFAITTAIDIVSKLPK
jgi:hypothetical protein